MSGERVPRVFVVQGLVDPRVVYHRKTERRRIESVDYLRGLLALCVMAYHYHAWSGVGGPFILTSFLAKAGIYAVLCFYVISGASFGYVYHDSMRLERGAMLEFWTKRFFRLAPLYWLVLFADIVPAVASGLHRGKFALPSAGAIIANLTLSFGVIDPHLYIPVGGWSIGNEMAYYVLFPFVLVALRRSPWAYAAYWPSA